jgi:hypothetical protein
MTAERALLAVTGSGGFTENHQPMQVGFYSLLISLIGAFS